MDFTTAILEELKGNTVEVLGPGCNEWVPFHEVFDPLTIEGIFNLESELHLFSFRIKKDTIIVNGEEVPAPLYNWGYGVCGLFWKPNHQ